MKFGICSIQRDRLYGFFLKDIIIFFDDLLINFKFLNLDFFMFFQLSSDRQTLDANGLQMEIDWQHIVFIILLAIKYFLFLPFFKATFPLQSERLK
jgi:hypothetical protein